jgi:GT2 family glycosyltransferase
MRGFVDTMLQSLEGLTSADEATQGRKHSSIVVAGPGSPLTMPGVIVSEIALAMTRRGTVTRIEVDPGAGGTVGLHRAPSLAAAHAAVFGDRITRFRAPANVRARTRALQDWVGPEVETAIAFAWPGIDNDWVRSFLQAAERVGASTTVVSPSLPTSNRGRLSTTILSRADLVVTGNDVQAAELASMWKGRGPKIEWHPSLSLRRHSDSPSPHEIVAFLPSEDHLSLTTLLAAFDAIPEAWISLYRLQVVIRHANDSIPALIRRSHHADQVRLVRQQLSDVEIRRLCASSSAVVVGHPSLDSRAFAAAVGAGVATVVVTDTALPLVGQSYVGALLADCLHPASVHVALTHALRLAELGFPGPAAWDDLAQRLRPVSDLTAMPDAGSGSQPVVATDTVAMPDLRLLPGLTDAPPDPEVGVGTPAADFPGSMQLPGRSVAERVSVVICAYTMDRWDDLVEAVASALRQTLQPDAVIVVIDHNEQLELRATIELAGATVVANRSTKGLSGARNTGVSFASGEIVAFLDDDAYAEDDWLERLVAPLSDGAIVGTGGWIVPNWETKPKAWFPTTFYWILGCSYAGLPAAGATLRNPIGANMAIRRRLFATVGGFTSGIGRIGKVPLGCEETELCIRYTARSPGERFVLVRDAVVHHRVPASRLTWHYFWTRCWAEGLSKAAVTSLVGTSSGLAAERRHVMRTIPRDVVDGLLSAPRHPRTAAIRCGLILAGVVAAAAGLLRGRIALRRSPIVNQEGTLYMAAPVTQADPSDDLAQVAEST